MTTRPQDSTTTPDDPPEATMPGFRPPPTRPGPDPFDPSTSTLSESTTTPPLSRGDVNGPGPAASDDVLPDAPPSSKQTRSSPASTADLPGLEDIVRTLVGLASMVVRAVRARRRPHLPPAVWIADEDDQAAIGDPLARIAARHAPVGGDDAGDVVDGMTALVGAAGYVVKNVTSEAAAGGLVLEVDEGQADDVAGVAAAGSW